MNQRGISFRLNLQITTIAIVIITAIVYLNYYFSNKVLVNKIEEGAINESNFVISKISRITIGTEEIAKNVSFQALYYFNDNKLDLFLDQVLRSNEILESIHVELLSKERHQLLKFSSNRSGHIICNPDSLTSEKFIFDLKSDNTRPIRGIWTSPFYSKNDTSHLLVSYKLPIYNPEKKEFIGVVS